MDSSSSDEEFDYIVDVSGQGFVVSMPTVPNICPYGNFLFVCHFLAGFRTFALLRENVEGLGVPSAAVGRYFSRPTGEFARLLEDQRRRYVQELLSSIPPDIVDLFLSFIPY
jgi:hypothetical protein